MFHQRQRPGLVKPGALHLAPLVGRFPTVTAIFRAEHAFLCSEQPPVGKKLYLYEGNFTALRMAATAEIVSSLKWCFGVDETQLFLFLFRVASRAASPRRGPVV